MKLCKNKKLNKEIRELQISIDYWTHYLDSYIYENREHAKQVIWYKSNAIRRLEKLKDNG